MQRFHASSTDTVAYLNGAVGHRTGAWPDCLGPYAKVKDCPIEGSDCRLTVYATDYADTHFSVPAATRWRGRAIKGFITHRDSGPVFVPYDSNPITGRQRAKVFYSGDVSLEHGGFYYTLDGYAVRVTPCSDAGCADNLFWIEELTFNLDADCRPALRSLGLPEDTTCLHTRIEALEAYGECYVEHLHTLRIGPPCPFTAGRDDPKPTLVLRASTDLRKWLRRRLREWL